MMATTTFYYAPENDAFKYLHLVAERVWD